MSSNNLNIIAAAAAVASPSPSSSSSSSSLLLPVASSSTSSLLPSATKSSPKPLVLPPKLLAASAISRLQWNGADYPIDDISRHHIHDHDVLSGRGGASNNHPGNEAFRQLVNRVKVDYLQCPKREKPLLAMRIVQAVRSQSPPGRFLQHDKLTDTWKDVGDAKAREKTSQALREGAPIIRDMVHKPSLPTLASVLKEVKKDERKNEPTKNNGSALTHNVEYSSILPSGPSGTPPSQPESAMNNLAFPDAHRPLSSLSIETTRPNFYQEHSVESRRVTGDFSTPARNEPPPIPFGIVRGLLLGHIDPVTAAASILSREEAAIVAQRYQYNQFNARQNLPMAAPTEIMHRTKNINGAALGMPCPTVSIDSAQLARTPSSSSSDQSESKERSVKSTTQPTSHRRTPLKKRKYVDVGVD